MPKQSLRSLFRRKQPTSDFESGDTHNDSYAWDTRHSRKHPTLNSFNRGRWGDKFKAGLFETPHDVLKYTRGGHHKSKSGANLNLKTRITILRAAENYFRKGEYGSTDLTEERKALEHEKKELSDLQKMMQIELSLQNNGDEVEEHYTSDYAQHLEYLYTLSDQHLQNDNPNRSYDILKEIYIHENFGSTQGNEIFSTRLLQNLGRTYEDLGATSFALACYKRAVGYHDSTHINRLEQKAALTGVDFHWIKEEIEGRLDHPVQEVAPKQDDKIDALYDLQERLDFS